MRVALRLLSLLSALVLLALVCSCARDAGPQLIEVLDVTPREVEAGDHLEVIGASFPQGKRAKVTFRGTLHRPGEKPESAEIAAEGEATSATQVAVDFTEGLQQLFCGVGEGAAHTTFDGELEVTFTAATAGVPAVSASLHAVTVDVRPPTPRRALLDARRTEGERALAYMGIKATKTAPPSGGIVVEAIEPGSRAEKAGLQANDLLTSLDKVRLTSLADAIPSGSHLLATFTLRRGASPAEIMREIPIESYRASPPADLYGGALLIGIAAAVLLFFLAPTVGLLSWVERRVAVRMQTRLGSTASPPPPVPAWGVGGLKALFERDVVSGSHDWWPRRAAPYLVLIGVSACFVVMPFGQYLIAADLDVGILYVLAVTSLVTLVLLSGAWSSGDDPFSVLARLRSMVAVVSDGVPGAIAVACIVMMTGSLRLQEIIHAQGGWPWEWFLFKSPVTFALFCLYFTTSLANGTSPVRREPTSGRAGRDAPHASASRYAWFLLAERANTLVMCGIAAALFMGGWQVPGLSTGAQEAHLGLQLLGALVFLTKAWALILAVLWVRSTWPRMQVDQRLTLCWKWLVPMAFAAFALSAAWVAWSPTKGVQTVLGAAMFAVFCVAFARFAVRVRYNLRTTSGDARLNPFL